jgi:hypothetical protein
VVLVFTHRKNDRIQTDAGVVEKDTAVHFAQRNRSGFTFETRPESCLKVHGHSQFSSEVVESSQRQHSQTLSASNELTGDSVDGSVTAARDHDVMPGLRSFPGCLDDLGWSLSTYNVAGETERGGHGLEFLPEICAVPFTRPIVQDDDG